MNDNRSFDDLMARLRAGSDAAAARVFNLYAQRLIALARSRLDARIRQKLDPEDIVQSVFRSFLTRQAGGAYELHDWDGLWRLLVSITIHKCLTRHQHFRAARRQVDIEVSATPASDASAGWDFIDRQPTPEEAAILTETMVEANRGLDETDRKIIEMLLQGHSHDDIHAETKKSVATVKRVVARVRKRLQRYLTADVQA